MDLIFQNDRSSTTSPILPNKKHKNNDIEPEKKQRRRSSRLSMQIKRKHDNVNTDVDSKINESDVDKQVKVNNLISSTSTSMEIPLDNSNPSSFTTSESNSKTESSARRKSVRLNLDGVIVSPVSRPNPPQKNNRRKSARLISFNNSTCSDILGDDTRKSDNARKNTNAMENKKSENNSNHSQDLSNKISSSFRPKSQSISCSISSQSSLNPSISARRHRLHTVDCLAPTEDLILPSTPEYPSKNNNSHFSSLCSQQELVLSELSRNNPLKKRTGPTLNRSISVFPEDDDDIIFTQPVPVKGRSKSDVSF